MRGMNGRRRGLKERKPEPKAHVTGGG